MTASPTPAPGRQRTLRTERRAELLAGLTLIALPMAFFLILRIGAIGYAFFISFWQWGLRGPREFLATQNTLFPYTTLF